MTSVNVSGLSKSYNTGSGAVPVFLDLSFQLAAGESLALTGPSGSGKSTLLNILCGVEGVDDGSMQVLGRDGATLTADQWAGLRRRRVGVVFQDSNLMPAMTLEENVKLRADLAGRSFGPVRDWLARLGLAGLEQRYPDQVSGGQRQRAALAMVFAMGPDLVLADEPTGSLDRHTARDVADALFHWQRTQGCGLILATHDLALAERCDRRLDLAEGGQG
ncbi:ABC transporter ATP-binding protein [Marinobacter zhanjiangensis]|uniref:ABC transporter ATP-binding protein n=1 Tax=Marinobacter zhanjiangensis TaxID=578215 RepID=UPI001D0FD5F3